MKKILSLLLAVSIVFGAASVAFAAETRYYLANRPLDLEDEAEPYEPAEVAPNANANPGTGC